MTREQILKVMLRWVGSTSLLAIPFVFAPQAWMDSIHRSLGMGPLPDAPVVGYLTRSLSAFYAMFGGMLWVVSSDLRRHRRLAIYFGSVIVPFGAVLFAIDAAEGMPRFWTLWEGPFIVAFGSAILWLSRGIARDGELR